MSTETLIRLCGPLGHHASYMGDVHLLGRGTTTGGSRVGARGVVVGHEAVRRAAGLPAERGVFRVVLWVALYRNHRAEKTTGCSGTSAGTRCP